MILAASLALLWQAGFVSGKVAASQGVAVPASTHDTQDKKANAPDIEGQAALVSANAATWQTVINAFGLVGLAFTVLYARRAWLAARDSAGADNANLELTKEALKEQRAGAVEQEKRLAEQTKIAEASLAEMRRATVEANRAWVIVSAEARGALTFDEEKISLMIYLRLENIGRSPANKITVDYGLFGRFSEAKQKARANTRDRKAQDWSDGDIMVPGEVSNIPIRLSIGREEFIESCRAMAADLNEEDRPIRGCPTVMVGVQYLLPGDNNFRFTYKNYSVRKRRPDPTFDGSVGVYEPDEFWLSDMRDGGPVT